MLDPARAAVDDGADRREAVVPDGPGSREFDGPWPDAVTADEWARMYPTLADVFSPRVTPAEDRIF